MILRVAWLSRVPTRALDLIRLPEDRESLRALLLEEREQQKRRAEEQTQRANDLQLQILRLQVELER